MADRSPSAQRSQSAETAPVRVRLGLPPALEGGLFSDVDWGFSSALMLTMGALFATLVWAESADFPIERAVVLDERIVTPFFLPPEPPPEERTREEPEAPPEDVEVADADASDPEPRAESPARVTRAAPEPSSAPPTPRIDVGAALAQHARALILGTDAPGEVGAFDALILGAGPNDAQAILDRASGMGSASAAPDPLRARSGGGSGHGGGLGGLRGGAPVREAREAEPLEERHITGRVDMADDWEGDTGAHFDSAALTRAIRVRARRIQGCYERELGRSPDLEGRVTVDLDVMPAGNVAHVTAVMNSTGSATLARCVVDHLKHLRLREGPADGPASFSFPFIFRRQQ